MKAALAASLLLSLSLAALGCGSSPTTGLVRTSPGAPVAEAPPPAAERVEEESMAVRGTTGSLSTGEVHGALEPRAQAFGMCFADHGRRLRTLGGRIQLAFHVDADGRVTRVRAVDSTIGHRRVERCILEVAAATRFPAPHGGEADFSWPLELDPPEHVRHPETWDPSRVTRVVRRLGPRLLRRCGADEDEAGFQVTTYVSRSGRVLAAGVVALDEAEEDPLDCLARQVRRWRMPRPQRHQAKVTFEIR